MSVRHQCNLGLLGKMAAVADQQELVKETRMALRLECNHLKHLPVLYRRGRYPALPSDPTTDTHCTHQSATNVTSALPNGTMGNAPIMPMTTGADLALPAIGALVDCAGDAAPDVPGSFWPMTASVGPRRCSPHLCHTMRGSSSWLPAASWCGTMRTV